MPKSDYIIVTELNHSSNVHLHILLWDDDLKTTYDLAFLRDHVRQHLETIKYCKNIKLVPRFHHIFFPDDVKERAEYISKDLKESTKYFPILISDCLYNIYNTIDDDSEDTLIEDV